MIKTDKRRTSDETHRRLSVMQLIMRLPRIVVDLELKTCAHPQDPEKNGIESVGLEQRITFLLIRAPKLL